MREYGENVVFSGDYKGRNRRRRPHNVKNVRFVEEIVQQLNCRYAHVLAPFMTTHVDLFSPDVVQR